MIEKTSESIVDRLSEKEQRNIGLQLINMGLTKIVTTSEPSTGNLDLVMREVSPVVTEIGLLNRDGIDGGRDKFLEELRKKCDKLPDLGVGFDDFVYDTTAADWIGHEDRFTREKTAARWKLKSVLTRARKMF
ncbi:MAG: hypothetical protein OEX81_02320 [Candidatus Pacebacteria bacterium]|nr:hypothetical protein [Candidatus Paceibacterota bacterium]